ncbi:MAG TPA: hypothetical protein VHV27_07905 [Phenylobacterium sp.]|jgi:hypothetical protein|nr:hypothetical protein [Phenylobacterium sp.]
MNLPSTTAIAAAAMLTCSAASAQPSPSPAPAPVEAPAQSAPASNTTVTVDADGVRHIVVANPPVRDTPESRAKYGKPMSNAGRRTRPAGD